MGTRTVCFYGELPTIAQYVQPLHHGQTFCYATTRANTPTCYQARPTDPNVSPTNRVEDLLGAERFHKGTLSFDESDTRDG